jgi:hypothetical protein
MVTRIDSVQDVLNFLSTVSPDLASQCATEIEAIWSEVAELEEPLELDADVLLIASAFSGSNGTSGGSACQASANSDHSKPIGEFESVGNNRRTPETG